MKRIRPPKRRAAQSKVADQPTDPILAAPVVTLPNGEARRLAYVNAVCTVILTFITAYYAYLTHGLLVQSERSLQVSQKPTIRILPEQVHGPGPGNFTLELVNEGLSDLVDVRIFEDHYVAVLDPTNRLNVVRFGRLNINPLINFDHLTAANRQSFSLDFSKDLSEMGAFYNSSDVKGSRMMLLRVLVESRRSLDGQPYSTLALYTIAGGGDYLIPYSDSLGLPGLAADQLKQVLAPSR